MRIAWLMDQSRFHHTISHENKNNRRIHANYNAKRVTLSVSVFLCFLENLCRIENTSKSIFQHIRVPLNAWHTMRRANFIYRFSNASDSQIYSNTCNHHSRVHYVCYTEHFDISLALLRDTTIMITLIKFRTYLKIYLEATRYLVQVRIL